MVSKPISFEAKKKNRQLTEWEEEADEEEVKNEKTKG